MQMRKKRRGYYFRRFLPYQWWKRLAYGAAVLLAVWLATTGRLPLAAIVFVATFATRTLDVAVGDQMRKRRSVGWHNYFDD